MEINFLERIGDRKFNYSILDPNLNIGVRNEQEPTNYWPCHQPTRRDQLNYPIHPIMSHLNNAAILIHSVQTNATKINSTDHLLNKHSLLPIWSFQDKLLNKLEDSEPEPPTSQDDECVICIHVRQIFCHHQQPVQFNPSSTSLPPSFNSGPCHNGDISLRTSSGVSSVLREDHPICSTGPNASPKMCNLSVSNNVLYTHAILTLSS